ncbi:MAG: PAS domain S-box protein [Campylobacterota bacterium]|nr:PAS domain S-box protein [Campylobacterota bacterium]
MKKLVFRFSFTKKYIFALSLIAFLAILAFLNLTTIINAQKNDGEIINMSGKQMMLSQKIALYAIKNDIAKVEEIVSIMQFSHKKLLSTKMSQEISKTYFAQPTMLDENVQFYLKQAKEFTETKSDKNLNYILENSQILLQKLDIAVSIYQKEAETKIQKLHIYEFYILVLTFLTLIMEALFIYRPIDKNIRKSTKALLAEKEYSDMITQTNTNGIIVVDEKFKILTFNKSAENMFGYKADEMIFTTLLDDRIIPKQYLQDHIAGLKNFMQKGELKNKNVVFELEAQRKDKKLFPIRISFGTKVENDKIIVVANIQDITNEKEKDTLLIQQSRLVAMGEMIGNIAHQWRQPLSAISTIASGAKLRHKNHLISDDELYESFEKIKEQTKHLSNTIDDFRDFFKHNNDDTSFNLNEVVEKSISLVEASYYSNNIKIVSDFKQKQVMLKGRGSELSQVILNILNNAKDILIEKKIKDRIVLVCIDIEDNYASINISDSAGGIADDIKMKVFDPYFTTKHKSQGTGIGLFMSDKIIKQHFNGILDTHNKEFEVDGNKYYGARFNIKIKLLDSK